MNTPPESPPADSNEEKRPTTVDAGRAAEELAAVYLKEHGFRIIRCNWRCRQGEVDIIAEEGEVIVFVEVKSRGRSDHGRPAEAVTRRKRARIVSAAALFAVSCGLADRAMRFDVVEVTERRGQPHFHHFPNAFTPAGRYQVL